LYRYQATPSDNGYEIRDSVTGTVQMMECDLNDSNECEKACEHIDRMNEEWKKTHNATVELVQRLNCFSNRDRIADIVHALRSEHRTLQQDFTRLCIAWFEKLAGLENYDYDLRMEASVKLAKALEHSPDFNDNKYLPTI